MRGMIKLLGTLTEVRKVNPGLPRQRIIACKTEHTTISQGIEESLRKTYGASVFEATIPKSKDIAASHLAREPLPFYAPKSKVTAAYEAMALEMTNGK